MSLEIDNFEIDYHFATPIFKISKPEFLNIVKVSFTSNLDKCKSERLEDNLYPTIMTHDIKEDKLLSDFTNYVSDISWDILNKQGYNMDLYYTRIDNMWGQHHPKTSGVGYHTHGSSSQLIGFYFVNVPEDSPGFFLYDPRSVKVHIDLPQRDESQYTSATNTYFYKPKAGDFIFANSWVPHSLGGNESNSPVEFIHINICVIEKSLIDDVNTFPVIV